jgi:hypothetical protein
MSRVLEKHVKDRHGMQVPLRLYQGFCFTLGATYEMLENTAFLLLLEKHLQMSI